MELRIPLSDLDFGPEEEQAVLDVLRRRWLTMGAITQEFEKEFADFVGANNAIAVSNGTDALHLAALALGIGPGDEVIVPALTFVATANAVLYTNAEVHFADIIGDENLNVSPQEIEKQITSQTKAIFLVHYGGYPCRMPEIVEIARCHNLVIVEDAAHAPGAAIDDRSLGTWGDIGCFSFFSNKNLATGEGGMVVTNRDDLAAKVRSLRSHGMTTLTWDRYHGHAYTYDVVALGHNYRIDEIRSALGLVQLHKLAKNNARRQVITARYRQGIKGKEFAGVELPFLNSTGVSSCHIFPILLPEDADRQVFMDAMRARGIQTSIHYPPIHHFSYYRKRYPGISLPITEAVARREVTLPLYPTLKDTDVDYVIVSSSEALTVARSCAANPVPDSV
ncbi:MAG: DegT/DnrJ/EryC1/StrS aminotransferase [Chloroflexi bacterium RBG_16_57_11]|nr:MAG: DegT/DnrJ/EryC1/StrS aminotransferase [Chloroflexi bacterium RBG_16_57_11]